MTSNSSFKSFWIRKTSRVGGVAGLVVLLLSLSTATPSFAIGVSGATPFAVAPSPDASGNARSYFVLQVSPGETAADSIVVSDQGRSPETLLISSATGVTATNSGTAFQGAFSPCSGVACWVSGLPSSVSLSPGESKTLRFKVNVPLGTSPSQYLAGITVKPAETPNAVGIGGNQKTSVNAVVIDQITVGVAVQTANLSQLSSKLVITGVSGTYFGTVPRLMVQVQNEGQRYARGGGTAVCTVNGQSQSFPVNVNTVLPGQGATVPVNAADFGSAAKCVVQFNYGVASTAWTGNVKLPVVTRGHLVPIAKGVYATLPPAKIPGWAMALLVGAGVVVILLIGTLLVVFRRRRKDKDDTGTGTPMPLSLDAATQSGEQ